MNTPYPITSAYRYPMSATTPPIEDLGGIHLLLVEDLEINAKIASRIISRWNVKVAVASNGKEAVEKCQAQPFDIILMDIRMPVMDGFEATRAIRVFNSTVPIIALSASESHDIQEEILGAGMNDSLPKPFEPANLFEMVKKWVIKPAA